MERDNVDQTDRQTTPEQDVKGGDGRAKASTSATSDLCDVSLVIHARPPPLPLREIGRQVGVEQDRARGVWTRLGCRPDGQFLVFGGRSTRLGPRLCVTLMAKHAFATAGSVRMSRFVLRWLCVCVRRGWRGPVVHPCRALSRCHRRSVARSTSLHGEVREGREGERRPGPRPCHRLPWVSVRAVIHVPRSRNCPSGNRPTED